MKILISTIFQDGGEATRALKIANIIKDFCCEEKLDIAFISRGSKFDQDVIKNGFRLIQAQPRVKFLNFHDEFQTKFAELFGNSEIAKNLLIREVEIYKKERPDVIINGFFPISTIARRVVSKNIIGISFLPLPLVENLLDEVEIFPEEIVFSNFSLSVQKFITSITPRFIKLKNPAIKHKNIAIAAKELGFNEPLNNIFEMLKSDLYLVTDYSCFYNVKNYPKNVVFTGVLIPEFPDVKIKDENILKIISSKNKMLKIFCSLGSVGEKRFLYEIVKMFNSDRGMNYSAIVLAPKEICDIDEIRAVLKNSNVYITDKFVPALKINKKMDLAITHGGQGTLQTAILSQTPIIGVGMQPEQEMNLYHLSKFKAAVKIKRKDWNVNNILTSINKVLSDDDYKKQILKLKNISLQRNTNDIIAKAVLDKIKNINYKQKNSF